MFICDLKVFLFFFNIFVREPEVQAPPIPALYFVLFFCIFDFLPYPGYPRIGLPENWMPDSVRTFTCCLVSEIQTLGLFIPYFASVNPEDFLKETMNFYMPMLFSWSAR